MRIAFILIVLIGIVGCFSSGPSSSDIHHAYSEVHQLGLNSIGLKNPKIERIIWHECKEMTDKVAWKCNFKVSLEGGREIEKSNRTFTKTAAGFVYSENEESYTLNREELASLTYDKVAVVACHAMKNENYAQLKNLTAENRLESAMEWYESEKVSRARENLSCKIIDFSPHRDGVQGDVAFEYWLKGPQSIMWVEKDKSGFWTFGNK